MQAPRGAPALGKDVTETDGACWGAHGDAWLSCVGVSQPRRGGRVSHAPQLTLLMRNSALLVSRSRSCCLLCQTELNSQPQRVGGHALMINSHRFSLVSTYSQGTSLFQRWQCEGEVLGALVSVGRFWALVCARVSQRATQDDCRCSKTPISSIVRVYFLEYVLKYTEHTEPVISCILLFRRKLNSF